MNTAKRFVSITAIGMVFVLVLGLVSGGMGTAIAASPFEGAQEALIINTDAQPVPVLPQGTTMVSGSVDVGNWPIDPLPVAQQGPVDVFGEVFGTVGIDPAANTVTIDGLGPLTVSGTVQIDSTTPVSVAAQGTTDVSGSVSVSNSTENPVPVAAQGTTDVTGSVSVSNSTSSPVPVAAQGTTNVAGSVSVNNSTSSPVPVVQQGAVNVSGTVGLSTSANTVKLDTNNNTVKVTNPSGQALNVNVVGGSTGDSAPEAVQFTSHYTANFSWTNAYQVPAGKILKIEFVSVYAETDGLWPVVSMRTTLGGNTVEYWLPRLETEYVQQEGNAAQIFSRMGYRMSTQVAIYADENTWVQSAGRCATSNCGNPGYNITFAGYLMDK
ncbi:MAG: hypothetical protein GXY68_11215 [Chloroflexi bacterium]|nr:hypothetical protein [Chloroflexota bacterium]